MQENGQELDPPCLTPLLKHTHLNTIITTVFFTNVFFQCFFFIITHVFFIDSVGPNIIYFFQVLL